MGIDTKDYDMESGEKGVYADDSTITHGETFVTGDSLYARLQRLAGRFGVEQRGIERVPESERTDSSLSNVATMVCLTEDALAT